MCPEHFSSEFLSTLHQQNIMLSLSTVIWLWTRRLYWIFTIEIDWKQLKMNLILESHSTDVTEHEKMRSFSKRCYGNPFTGFTLNQDAI